jgi:hypothetical protein
MGPYAGANYITVPYVDFRVDSNTFTNGNPMPKLTLILSWNFFKIYGG